MTARPVRPSPWGQVAQSPQCLWREHALLARHGVGTGVRTTGIGAGAQCRFRHFGGALRTDADGNAGIRSSYTGCDAARAIRLHFKVHIRNRAFLTRQALRPEPGNGAALAMAPWAACRCSSSWSRWLASRPEGQLLVRPRNDGPPIHLACFAVSHAYAGGWWAVADMRSAMRSSMACSAVASVSGPTSRRCVAPSSVRGRSVR